MKAKQDVEFMLSPLPQNHEEAVQWLLRLVKAADDEVLTIVPMDDFKRGWYAIAFLYPGLHPDSALDHGSTVSSTMDETPEIDLVDHRLAVPFYLESGWPVVLAPVTQEAWRRYRAGCLGEDEFYCSEAVVAGMCFRNPELLERVQQERQKTGA